MKTKELTMTSAVLSLNQPPFQLQQFQQQLGEYLRDQDPVKTAQKHNALVEHLPARAGSVYQELVFNNVTSFINQCFPICQTIVDEDVWQKLSVVFFQQGDLHSPYFTEINKHFVDFLYGLNDEQRGSLQLPPFFADLAHYEWVELMLDVYPDADNSDIFLQTRLNPALQNLHYSWAVHRIGAEHQPQMPEDSFFLVYRDVDHHIKFMEINAMTHALVGFMQQKTMENQSFDSATAVIKAFFNTVGGDQPQMLDFAMQLLEQLTQQHILMMRQ